MRRGLLDAVVEAAQLRLCPILMTSLTFILGASRWFYPTAPPRRCVRRLVSCVCQMVGVAFFGLLLMPVF
jgi:Cu/Ag efflux pump CusA